MLIFNIPISPIYKQPVVRNDTKEKLFRKNLNFFLTLIYGEFKKGNKKNCRYFYRQFGYRSNQVKCSILHYPYWNKDKMFCFEAFACASMAIEACWRTWVRARLLDSAAKSASIMRPFATARFVATFCRLAIA